LLEDGEQVLDVPAKLVARIRLFIPRGSARAVLRQEVHTVVDVP
jgi:hypothetical protein